MSIDLLVAALLAVRRGGPPLAFHPDLVPGHQAAAYAVQDRVATAVRDTDGPVVAWKVGASAPDAEPAAAPILAATLFPDVPGPRPGSFRRLGVEAELAYRFDRAPVLRNGRCDDAAVRDALGSVHVAMEVLDPRFAQLDEVPPLLQSADQGNHGALILGPGRRDWDRLVPVQEPVTVRLDGAVAVSHRGGNSAGDPIRLLSWLAGHAAGRGQPLTAGTIVTTGSTVGTFWVEPGVTVEIAFEALGSLSLKTVSPG